MKTIIPSVKGTRDFYPEVMAIRTWLYQMIKEVSEAFGYEEYEAPILEALELYAAKSGEELVKEQSFVFFDRGGDQLVLRPELTPSLARMVAQRQRQLIYPLRWWSFGPFWRYERPQKGRTREFFQWNIDLIGVDTPEADAELIAIVAAFFQKVGLRPSEASIRINNRRLMDAEILAMGIPLEKKGEVSSLIDRRSKLSADDWDQYALDLGILPNQLELLKDVLSNQDLWKKSPELVRVMSALDAMGLTEYVCFDPNVVRGLLYYTGTVFEAYDLTGDLKRAILGGGRYDNLLKDVGGEALSGVGFAMGDVVIALLLQSLGRIPAAIGGKRPDVLITVFDDSTRPASLALAAELRQAGLNVACSPEAGKLPKQFKYADRTGIQIAIVIGPDELASGQVTVKNLGSGDQKTVLRSQAAAAIKNFMAG